MKIFGFVALSFFLISLIYITLLVRKPGFALDPLRKCNVKSYVEISDEDPDFKIKITKFESKETKPKRAILLLPPTGGKNIIDLGYAYMFCKKGFNVHILESWSGDRGVEDYVLDFGIHQRYMTKTQKGIELALKKMDYESIGVLGTSAGAINFSVALGNEYTLSKVDSFFGIVGAMPLCKVLARAGEQGLKKVREGRFKEFGFKSLAEYENKICSVLDSKIPGVLSEKIRYGSIIATKDTTVPYELQLKQIEDWKPKFSKKLDTSHVGAVVQAFLFHRKKILNFFL